jgi:hypothetical protein
VLLVLLFLKIQHHYLDAAAQLRVPEAAEIPQVRNTVVVLVPNLHFGVLHALQYAKLLAPDCRAVHIETDPQQTAALQQEWRRCEPKVPLVVLSSSYRSLIGPIIKYLDDVQAERADDFVTVVIPEAVPARWWQHLLHGQSGLLLNAALLTRPDVVVANVRYPLKHTPRLPTG